MPQVPTIVLWLWVPCTLWFFKRWPAPWAILASMIGGWLILPTAAFSADTARSEFPYWVMPACLPALWTTKARLIALGCLLGVALFDPRTLRSLRIVGADFFMAGWCVCPLVSALANSLYLSEAIANSAYQALCWGVPYLLGRLYFASPTGMIGLARGMIVGGLIYVPLCLLEWVFGPCFYQTFFAFHPYQYQGSERYLGYRPIVFLEDGNQLGMWMASVALIAVWLWRSGQLPRVWRISGKQVVIALVGVAFLAQSVGAIVLLLIGLAGLEGVFRLDRIWPLAVVLALLLGVVGLRAANVIDTKAVAQRSSVGRALIGASIKLDRQSFGWRLRVEERQTRTALERPLFGWGRWDWWRQNQGAERPWGLFGLVLGMYGVTGLLLLLVSVVWPLQQFLRLGPPRVWTGSNMAATTALAAALAINVLDAALNGAFLLPLMLVAGGLAGLGSSRDRGSTNADTRGNVRYRVR